MMAVILTYHMYVKGGGKVEASEVGGGYQQISS
jgi:hypothetical protein